MQDCGLVPEQPSEGSGWAGSPRNLGGVARGLSMQTMPGGEWEQDPALLSPGMPYLAAVLRSRLSSVMPMSRG